MRPSDNSSEGSQTGRQVFHPPMNPPPHQWNPHAPYYVTSEYPPYQQQHPVMQNQGHLPPQQYYYAPVSQPGSVDPSGTAGVHQPPPAAYNVYNPPPATAGSMPPASSAYWSTQPDTGGHAGSGADIPFDKLVTSDTDIKIRHGFVRKVYGILSAQLAVTFGIALLFTLVQPMRFWVIENSWILLVCLGVVLTCVLVLVCCTAVARKHPWNMIFLLILSLAFGVILGSAGAVVGSDSFLIACGITAGVTIGLTIFACQTRWDFTGCGVYLFVAMLVLVIFGIVAAIIRDRVVHIVYAALGTLLFSFYIVYDTQKIVGGKHRKYQVSIDDYIFAALALYMDIINLFMFILTLVGAARE